MKLLYFHVPKTAGSSINKFFSQNTERYSFHIEGVENLDNSFFNKYDFLSGHVAYNHINSMIDLRDWITFITLREPISYVISHLKWVRKLADKGEEERLLEHPPIFQKIALEMLKYDFSKSQDISSFIQWLDSINFKYFHNTQLHYLNSNRREKFFTDEEIGEALENLHKINFVGIQENLNEFIEIISYEFGWNLPHSTPNVNVNSENYGFNINDKKTREALKPLYEQDMIIYNEAKKIFNFQKNLYSATSDKNIIGYIDKVTDKKIVGWARFINNLNKVELELKINNSILQTTTANIMREGLKRKGIHPTGLASFEFNLKEKVNSNFKICVKNTDICLGFSHEV